MKCLQLLLVCWCSSILPAAVTSCFRDIGSSCWSTYRDTITCDLNITGQPNNTYSLKYTDSDGKDTISCPLVVINHTYSCDCKVKEGSFISNDEYDIELCHKSDCCPVKKRFAPSQNTQVTPPHDVEVQQTPETVNVTWKSGYEDHKTVSDKLVYEIVLQRSQRTENDAHSLTSHETFVSIPRSQLKPDATYCIRVRSLLHCPPDYEGTWSEWSKSTRCKNEVAAVERLHVFSEQENILVILAKYLGPLCVVAGVMLFVFYSPAVRMKIKTLSHTPSPAPFFDSLFQQHEGNLQEWLSPQGKYMLTYKTEEVLASDAVIVVPKPTSKNPEENQDLHNALVTQLTFTQCQTSSYVGLPGIHEAPLPLTMVCPGNMSYTQLPCPAWGVDIEEVEVVSPPPKDFFNISHADSGCEDLTQSPESSLPNSPVDDTPPPCYCTDYCILNKTAQGFSPVLVSKAPA